MDRPISKHVVIPALASLLMLAPVDAISAQENGAMRFAAADSPGVSARRDENTVYLTISGDERYSVAMPRLVAPLQTLAWQGGNGAHGLQLKPDQNRWTISWKSRPEKATTIVLELASAAKLPSEITPIRAAADGSIFFAAHLAKTTGEKIRYEPQTHKNTVGYWTGIGDTASWKFRVDLPGRFNVGILQGCGKGHGGSRAKLEVANAAEGESVEKLEFDVLETGHFQNFQWRHLGQIEIGASGEHSLRIMPVNIKKAALMDVRAVHLIRVP